MIVAGFVLFKVLDNSIGITKENIELKAKVEQLKLKQLQLNLNTQKQKMNSLNSKINAMIKILLENKKQTIKRNYVLSQNSMENHKDSIDY